MTTLSRALTVLTLAASLCSLCTASGRRIDNREKYDEYKAYLQNYFDTFLQEYAPSSILNEGAALIVIDGETDEEMFEIESSFGYLGRHGMMNMASGSKFIAGIVMLKCIDENEGLTLDSTVGEILGWNDSPVKDITMDMLGAQVSGLSGDITICQMVPYSDHRACVEELRHNPVKAPAGKQFEYQALGTGFQIANAMCEEVSGKRFKDYFDELKAVLEIDNENMRFGCPRCPTWMIRQGMYDNNPNLGAGLDANVDGYVRFMQLLLNKGKWKGQQVISEETVMRVTKNPYWPDVLDYMKPCWPELGDRPCMESSGGNEQPMVPWNYGFFSQLWCTSDGEVNMDPHDPEATQCPNIGHGGAWGAYNWFDQKRGYAASLLMESDIHQSGEALAVGSSLARSIMDMIAWVLEPEDSPGPGPQNVPEEFDFSKITSTQPCQEHSDCGYAECSHEGYTVPHFCHDYAEGTKVCMSMFTDFNRCAEWRNPLVNTVAYADLGDGHFCSKGNAVMICPANPKLAGEAVARRLMGGEA